MNSSKNKRALDSKCVYINDSQMEVLTKLVKLKQSIVSTYLVE